MSGSGGHSYQRYVACGVCGDLDGCHLWREAEDRAVPSLPPGVKTQEPKPAWTERPVYHARYAEHREVERAKAPALIAALPPGPISAEAFGALVFDLLTAPERVAAEALARMKFENAEMTTVDRKTVIRYRAGGMQFIIAVGEDA